MAKRNVNEPPSFLRQALLILLPLAVLAVVSALSLRQDRILAEHDAAERAQSILSDLTPKLWEAIASTNTLPGSTQPLHWFSVDSYGRLVQPAPLPGAPDPKPLDLANLNTEQKHLWLRARANEMESGHSQTPGGPALSTAEQTYREFLGTSPPDAFAAAAYYSLALEQAARGEFQKAGDSLDALLGKYPGAHGETGLPLKPLAQLKLIELSRRAPNLGPWTNMVSLEVFCWNIVMEPTPLTEYILKHLAELVRAGDDKLEEKLSAGPNGLWSALSANLSAEEQKKAQDVTIVADLTEDEKKKARDLLIVRSWNRNWDEQQLNRQLFRAASPQLITYIQASLDAHPLLSQQPAIPVTNLKAWLPMESPGVFWFSDSNTVSVIPPALEDTHTPPASRESITWTAINNRSASRNTISITNLTWLAIQRLPAELHGQAFVCRPEYEIGAIISKMVALEQQMPGYFGVSVEIAGRKITWRAPDLQLWFDRRHGGKEGWSERVLPGGEATNVLASVTGSDPLSRQMKVNILLTSPWTLYQRQRTRTFWFGSLIAVSAASALAGLLAAWRAFRRQVALGKLKSNFVSSVSHELRAPIASVRLMAESLESGKVQDAQKQTQYFRFIGQECRRLSALIENVLDFARIEERRKEYEFEPTDLTALARQTVATMENYAAEKQITLALVVTEAPLSASCDGHALHQALVNLIDNAIKHSPNGGTVKVGVEGARAEERGAANRSRALEPLNSHLALLWVEDDGQGIPAEEVPKIFERFYRRGSELRRETQGVGIGLSIVKHIVEAHGGQITVQSVEGKGSTFKIELPLEQEVVTTRSWNES